MESNTEYSIRIDGPYAEIERITPGGQTPLEAAKSCRPSLYYPVFLSTTIQYSPSVDHPVRLNSAKATDACVRFDTSHKIHLADVESAIAT